jgi:DNA repair protein SbcC/Rad50
MSFRLKSLTVENFRSIRGRLTVSLDAPVVLIHGQNGSGKTSLLSAIEFALTGGVPSLERLDPDYIKYLPHKSAEGAPSKVAIKVSGFEGKNEAELEVGVDAGMQAPLLSKDLAKFFSERCYLAQSTLSRLLEIYQHQDGRRSDSPLTRFVKDLLGLDYLDALIEGLHMAGNIRRVRDAVPAYRQTAEDISEIEKILARLEDDSKNIEAETSVTARRLIERLPALDIGVSEISRDPIVIGSMLAPSNDKDLYSLARTRRDLAAILEQWHAANSDLAVADGRAIEQQETVSRAALQVWRNTAGALLANVLAEVQLSFPNLPRLEDAGPRRARDAALLAVNRELRRLSDVFAAHEAGTGRILSVQESIARGKSRIEALDLQISQNAPVSESIAEALAELIPYVQSDDCPLCGRDFAEISKIPLKAYLSSRIASLVETTGRLRALVSDKTTTLGVLSGAERELEELLARQLLPDQFDQLKPRLARLNELSAHLVELEATAAEGNILEQAATDAVRRLAQFRGNDQVATSLRATVDQLAANLSQPPLDVAESVGRGVERLQSYVEAREAAVAQREALRREALEDVAILTDVRARSVRLKDEAAELGERLTRLKSAKKEADRRIGLAKAVVQESLERRTQIVQRVFNDELNKIWQDLFVRLAPEEAFVPAFALPTKSTAPVEAVLETVYQGEGRGGNPRTILSAGNLNTAALTLFLALHLSARPKLPWLLIDDPVQSMDEVHVAQFAALLRTLSKQKDRQIIIAVHE